jgi:hypothetical protein
MICPHCHAEFEASPAACPQCGVRLLRSISGIVKTSAVMIAARGERGFYHSVQDVPEPLRTQLIETTGSPDAGTIVIADRAGKDQITQGLARREARANASGAAASTATASVPARWRGLRRLSAAYLRKNWLAWAGFVLVLALAGVAAALFDLRW